MASALPFLRPLPPPRASFVQCLLRRISTTAQITQEAPTPYPTAAPQTTIPALPYHVNRTTSNQLPIYNITKGGGGTSKLTRLRKIDGDLAVLRSDLQQALQLKDEHIAINQLTRHIVIKGWRKTDVAKFLEERQF
ncbi:MAG: mitochondrial large ribosomal subunit [Lasallia pustulata]|uniref:Large ribosomal subunit protein mL49 n=1 Tax=Lasallia pustulata TaxID=136370 RepID=A0A5M8PQD3_9LECA|nr:MAG: mitochondrial large ribosomal subunit [Lasallia pustulata]